LESEAELHLRELTRVSEKEALKMPKQAKKKPRKGTVVKIHFPNTELSQKKAAALHKHVKELAPELVRGLVEKTGDETLGVFNTFKESGP
jgi:hypothetical protein